MFITTKSPAVRPRKNKIREMLRKQKVAKIKKTVAVNDGQGNEAQATKKS